MRLRMRFLVGAAVVAATLGCSAWQPMPATESAIAVPARWSGADPAATSDALTSEVRQPAWWQRFDDPLLDQLVTQALQANTSVASARAVLQQARALRDVAAAALWPSLSGSASAQRNLASSRAGGQGSGNVFQAGVDANWVPDVFGANRSALRASTAVAQAEAASLGAVQVSVAGEVALNYIVLRSAQARLAIAADNLASQQDTLQITRWREQAGLVTTLEAEQARAAAEQTRALLPAWQTSVEQTGHALAVLTGQAPAALSPLLATAQPVPNTRGDVPMTLPAETLRRRADVRAAELQVSAAWARVAQADAARFPGFALGGSLGLSAASVGSLGSGAAVVGALLASMAVPLLDGGAARAQVRAQQAAFEQARLAYQASVLTALTDVEDALAALRGDRLRLLSLRNAADAAANAAALARQRFASGLVDFQTVLETQRTQLGTQDLVASASADVSGDLVRLFTALGGGWREDADVGSDGGADGRSASVGAAP